MKLSKLLYQNKNNKFKSNITFLTFSLHSIVPDAFLQVINLCFAIVHPADDGIGRQMKKCVQRD